MWVTEHGSESCPVDHMKDRVHFPKGTDQWLFYNAFSTMMDDGSRIKSQTILIHVLELICVSWKIK